jgi:hypothetical protein
MHPYHATTHDGRRITIHARNDKHARQLCYLNSLTNPKRTTSKDRP